MDQEKQWVDGLRIEQPHEKAPEFVKAKGSIKCADMLEFCKMNLDKGSEWVNFDVKVSQKGTWYSEVNTWKPEGEQGQTASTPQASVDATDLSQYNKENPTQGGDMIVDDIPF